MDVDRFLFDSDIFDQLHVGPILTFIAFECIAEIGCLFGAVPADLECMVRNVLVF